MKAAKKKPAKKKKKNPYEGMLLGGDPPKTIIAWDPGAKCAYALANRIGSGYRIIDAGVLPEGWGAHAIQDALGRTIEGCPPDTVLGIVESQFFSGNAATLTNLVLRRGKIETVLELAGIRSVPVMPRAWQTVLQMDFGEARDALKTASIEQARSYYKNLSEDESDAINMLRWAGAKISELLGESDAAG